LLPWRQAHGYDQDSGGYVNSSFSMEEEEEDKLSSVSSPSNAKRGIAPILYSSQPNSNNPSKIKYKPRPISKQGLQNRRQYFKRKVFQIWKWSGALVMVYVVSIVLCRHLQLPIYILKWEGYLANLELVG